MARYTYNITSGLVEIESTVNPDLGFWGFFKETSTVFDMVTDGNVVQLQVGMWPCWRPVKND